MDLMELSRYAGDEGKAEELLRRIGILRTFVSCPFCGGTRFSRVRRGRFKCYGCRREWSIRRDSMLEGLRTPFAKFLMAVKLFELDTSANAAKKQLGVSYNTVYGIFDLLRRSISSMDSEQFSFSGEYLRLMSPNFSAENAGENVVEGRLGRFLSLVFWKEVARSVLRL
jgi:transposase-like protein